MPESNHPKSLPCGAWPSPLSPEAMAAGSVAPAFAAMARGRLHWVEGRPAERGRSVLLTQNDSGGVVEVLGAEADVRSRVHEYGGMPWAAVGEALIWSQFDDQRLRVLRPDGQVHVLTPPGCRYADFCAAPDGVHVVAVREDHRGGGEAVNTVVRLNTQRDQDEGELLFLGSDFVAWPRLDVSGQRLAVVSWNHPTMPWDETLLQVADLPERPEAVADAAAPTAPTFSWTTVAGGPGEAVAEPQWAADGSLYFLSDRSGYSNLYRWRDGQVQAVTAAAADIGGPLWQLGQAAYRLINNGQALLRLGRNTVEQLCLLDLATGQLTPLDLPFVAFANLGLQDAHHAFALASAVDAMTALVAIHVRSGAHEVLRRACDLPLPADALSAAQAIDFPTHAAPDGTPRSAHAWFYPPHLPGHAVPVGEAPPLIVLLHGGPTGQSGPAFKAGVQFWTTRGFAVVDVNYGGSSGFGRAYRERLKGLWGVVDLQDAVASVDHLVAQGLVDGARVVIRGGSAGGFSVLCGLAFTKRFAAGINYFGVADLESLVVDTHKFESRYLDGLVAPLPEGLAIYQARSPVRHMQHCHGALFTLQGSDDKAVPPSQSRAIVAAARAAGCAVAYVEFEGEGHGFRQAGNIVRALQLELAFLGRVLGYAPADVVPAIDIDNASVLNTAGLKA